ncbi:MAG: VTT domain-containing protein [Candidatus Thorarchaeota archaeon]
MQDVTQFIIDLIVQGHLGLFLASLLLNLSPVAPSNMVVAGVASVLLPMIDWISIGFIVAAASTTAKSIHYWLIRSSRIVLSERRLQQLEAEKQRVEKWGAFALFLAAASPMPDDPVIVYVGFTEYSAPKFIISYFTGKVLVTLAGAYIGYTVGGFFSSIPMAIASVGLTIIITLYLLAREKAKQPTVLEEVLEERKQNPRKAPYDDESVLEGDNESLNEPKK